MAQFLQWIGKNNHYRECSGFEKDENGKAVYNKPTYRDEHLSHSVYFGKNKIQFYKLRIARSVPTIIVIIFVKLNR